MSSQSVRNDFLLFPTLAELQAILAKEQPRLIPKGKETTHFPDFTAIIHLLNAFDLDPSLFVEHYTYADISGKNIPAIARGLSDAAVSRMLGSSPPIDLLQKVYAYLSEEDAPVKADIVFVFGSKTNTRIQKAVEVFKETEAAFLMVSGNAPIYDTTQQQAEADRLFMFALEHGVPEEKIIVEKTSISLPDNVRTSLNILDLKGIAYQSILLVNSPYAQRRGWAHFKKYTKEGTNIIRINAQTIDQYTKANWFTSEPGIRVILNEYIKMKVAVILNTA